MNYFFRTLMAFVVAALIVLYILVIVDRKPPVIAILDVGVEVTEGNDRTFLPFDAIDYIEHGNRTALVNYSKQLGIVVEDETQYKELTQKYRDYLAKE